MRMRANSSEQPSIDQMLEILLSIICIVSVKGREGLSDEVRTALGVICNSRVSHQSNLAAVRGAAHSSTRISVGRDLDLEIES